MKEVFNKSLLMLFYESRLHGCCTFVNGMLFFIKTSLMYVFFFIFVINLTLYLVIIIKFHFIFSKTHTGSFKLSKLQLITMHCYIFLSNIIFFRRTVFVIKYYDFKPSYLYMYTIVSYTCILIYFSRA